MGLMALGLVLLGSCSSDEEQPTSVSQGTAIELTGLVRGYLEDEGAKKVNKVCDPGKNYWTIRRDPPVWLPAGYSLLESTTYPAIGIFLTNDAKETVATRIWHDSEGDWRITDTPDPGTYQLYGYVPKDAATASIAPNGTYAEGAVLTLTGLSPVSDKDVCIVVGANCVNTSDVPTVAIGSFDCDFRDSESEGKTEDDKNYLYLLFDHLYAAISFQFKVDPVYATLRTIKIRRLAIKAYEDEWVTPLKASITNTITLTKNGNSPMVDEADNGADPSPVAETPVGGDMGPTMFFRDDESPVVLNSSDWSAPMMAYVTKNMTNFLLHTTYDVYDADGTTKIRQDCEAVNKIHVDELLGALRRGYRYSLRFTVNPTYLYQLGDPDLDNPTITID